MSTVTVYSVEKQQVGELPIPAFMAESKVCTGLLHEAVQAARTNARQGTVSTKTRAEVRGGGKKPYKQKGTGRARHGSTRSPLFVTGGQTFGPRPRHWEYAMPQQQRRAALSQALTLKLREGKLVVIDDWGVTAPKTKPLVKILQTLGVQNGLLVLDRPNTAVSRSARNIPGIGIREARCLNTAIILQHDYLVFTKAAFEQLQGYAA
ncbi:MAG: 50S ribosomal protein L4 [Deltaproteobacteria bacterium]|nr:50S ribosomal protein L4 [Deltaproteobacteria bacterium]